MAIRETGSVRALALVGPTSAGKTALMEALLEAATGTAVTVPGQAIPNLIDVAQVQGQVHAQSVHRVGELAERNPNETATIVRQWLSEPAE